MTHRIRRTALIVSPVLLALATSLMTAWAAGPCILMVYGPPLAKPVTLHNWPENEQFMVAAVDTATVTPAQLGGRPYMSLALFWGSPWEQYVNQGKPLTALRPAQANQCARLYPAYGTARPVLALDSDRVPSEWQLRQIGSEGLAILARHGIPVRLKVRSKLPAPSKAHCTSYLP